MGKSDNNTYWHTNMDTWEFHLNYVRHSVSLTEDEKKEVLDGLAKLMQVFDHNWLRQARQDHHPLVSYFLNKAAWSQFWLAEFGGELHAMGNLPRFKSLRNRLRNSEQYAGAEAEVETVVKIMAAGITDIELYPTVEVKGKRRKPDLRATVDGEDIYFEVFALREGGKSHIAFMTHQELVSPFFDRETLHQLLAFCQIHTILSKPDIKKLKDKIIQAVEYVKESKDHAYVQEPGVLDCLVIHRSKQAECDALVKRFGMKREISGPPFESDDLERLISNMQDEIETQLPRDRPGVVIAFANPIYFGEPESFYEDLAGQVEETIRGQDQVVLGVVINKTAHLRQVGNVDQKPNYILVRKSHNLVQETVIVIKNICSKFPVNEKILRAFTS